MWTCFGSSVSVVTCDFLGKFIKLMKPIRMSAPVAAPRLGTPKPRRYNKW